MAYQFKTSKAKEQSPTFLISKKDFKLLKELAILQNLSRAELMAGILILHFKGEKKYEVFTKAKRRKTKKKIPS
ncbi:hypothetical protein DMB92_05320 [Campylobacter sp. MIT 99-7217]|uniref:hypothetical protein n=1 Tax=Campylobacter sp. MIT 99-7217 TaxID=535091 RepID=UPI001158627D|nr:hypothetical protein [Campylobacter sp. MIT 99-7217]TQR31809.1 hypothetical protein DMB92_05320 [Campylobacter sp. MIT 99-7217]